MSLMKGFSIKFHINLFMGYFIDQMNLNSRICQLTSLKAIMISETVCSEVFQYELKNFVLKQLPLQNHVHCLY